jgi:type II secretory pathway pseudopilin PulG
MIAKKTGITIIETIVYIAVFVVVMGAAAGFIVYFYKTNSYVLEQAFAVREARRGIETMVREIREATYSDTGAYPVIQASDQSFSFYSDIDRDNNVERVRYFLDGTNFMKGETEAVGDPPNYKDENEITSIVSDNVRNGAAEIFSYYDASGSQITDLSQVTKIRLVRAELIVNVDPNRPPNDFILRSNAQLRNL